MIYFQLTQLRIVLLPLLTVRLMQFPPLVTPIGPPFSHSTIIATVMFGQLVQRLLGNQSDCQPVRNLLWASLKTPALTHTAINQLHLM